MTDHIYKKLEIVGSSPTSVDDAIRSAISKASDSVQQMRWFEVTEIRGEINHDEVTQFQVTMKLGFTVAD